MKKDNYRTKIVNEINWPELGQQLGGQAETFAVDVVKAQQFALLTTTGQSHVGWVEERNPASQKGSWVSTKLQSSLRPLIA